MKLADSKGVVEDYDFAKEFYVGHLVLIICLSI